MKIKDGEIEGLRPVAQVVKKQILTDIRDYLLKKQEFYKPQLCHMDRLMFFIYSEQLYDLTEYAEKLGVEL